MGSIRIARRQTIGLASRKSPMDWRPAIEHTRVPMPAEWAARGTGYPRERLHQRGKLALPRGTRLDRSLRILIAPFAGSHAQREER